MTCQSLGCYAMTFRRNLCRVHYELWRDQLDERPRVRHGGPAVNLRCPPFVGVCVCSTPMPGRVGGIFGPVEMCQRCGKPPAASLTLNPPERNIG